MDKDTLLSRKPGIYTAQMNGETVMMDIDSGKYFNLGEVGGRIWDILEQPMTLGALVERLTAEYSVTAERCEADIVPFLEKMASRGLIR